MEMFNKQTFGPVIGIIKIDTEEVLKADKNSTYGLAGYFYSSNVSQCARVAGKLE